jgi:hypothetical protein
MSERKRWCQREKGVMLERIRGRGSEGGKEKRDREKRKSKDQRGKRKRDDGRE